VAEHGPDSLQRLSAAPVRRRVNRAVDSVRVRAPGFWAGPRGLVTMLLTLGVVIALLIGWVLTWATEEDGPNAVWLTLGPLAFSFVVALLTALFWSLRQSTRLRHAEIAFLTGASHNLRTPLSAIRAAIQTLATTGERLAPEDKRLLFEAVMNETNRLELRIDNLIETARLDLEQKPYDIGPFDLTTLVRDVLDEARWAFAARAGTFTVTAPDEPLVIDGDRRALKLVLENLVDNALKYTDEPPLVEVNCSRSAEHAVVRVKDAGIGFSSAVTDAVFSGRREGDTGYRGSGIGLRLSRTIARGHGGEVRLHSPGDRLGATAEVWLPIAESDE